MEIANYCIAFNIGVFFTLIVFFIREIIKGKKQTINKVHFYVARNYDGILNVFFNKPSRNYAFMKWVSHDFSALENGKYKWKSTRIVESDYFKDLGLNPDDFKNLKWENEPVEVFLNLED